MGKSRRKDLREVDQKEEELRNYSLALLLPLMIFVAVLSALLARAIIQKNEPELQPPLSTVEATEELPATMAEIEIEPDNKEYIYDFGSGILNKDENPKVLQLMEDYFKAIKEVDLDTFFELFTSQSSEGEESYRAQFEAQNQYITGYSNISCYTTAGLAPGELVAYVYYEVNYKDVATPAPSLIHIYVIEGEDGIYRIEDGEMSEERTQFLAQLDANEDVRLLCSEVEDGLAQAMEADEALRERMEYLKQGAEYMQQEEEIAE